MKLALLTGNFIRPQFLLITENNKAVELPKWLKGGTVRQLKHLILGHNTPYCRLEVLTPEEAVFVFRAALNLLF